MKARDTVSRLIDEPTSGTLALVAAREDGEAVGQFTLAGWVPRTGVIVPGAARASSRVLLAYAAVGAACAAAAAALIAGFWQNPVAWLPALTLAGLALFVQFFPLQVSNADVSMAVGFLLASCLMCGPAAGAAVVAGVLAAWSLGRELLPWFIRQRSASLAFGLARSLFTTGSGALVYFAASFVAFSIFDLDAPVGRVSAETLGAAVVLTVGVYVLLNACSLVVAVISGDNPASYLRVVIPLPALVEFLALPAALLLVVTQVRLGMAAFILLAWLYLMAAYLGWRSWHDRTNLHRRLEDVELLHRVGASLGGTLEMGELILRFRKALGEIFSFEDMLLVLTDDSEEISQAFAFDGAGARGEVTRQRLADTEGRPEGLVINDRGSATFVRDFAAGEAATIRLRLDFELALLPSSHKMVLLETVCQQAGTALSNAHLFRLANTDPLTGLASRRYFDRALRAAAVRDESFAVIMLDLDWFKKVNDERGHRAGDMVLRDLADCLRGSLRVMDVAARYGGEEFVILLPAAESPEAAAVAERIRRTISHRQLEVDGHQLGYTASFGVADAPTDEPREDPMTVVWRADEALLEAKRAGRNQVVTYSALQR